MTTTVRRHLASRDNLRQQRVVALTERGERAVEQGRAARVELTPAASQTSVELCETKGARDGLDSCFIDCGGCAVDFQIPR